MRTALRKVWRDLWRSKGRTLLVVMSIAVGVLAVGMISSSNRILDLQLALAQEGIQPSHGILFLTGRVDEDTVQNLSRLPQVKAIEGRLTATTRWKANPNDEWQDTNLRAILDYDDQQFDLVTQTTGTWPGRNEAAVAYNHQEPYGLPGEGESIYLEINDRERPIRISGTVRDPYELSPPFSAAPALYVTPDLFRKITGFSTYSELRLTVPVYSEENVEGAVDEIERNISRLGLSVAFAQVLNPDEHFTQSTMDGIGLILTVMAVASLGLSTFLVVNTMNALLTQQVPQIGIMKTVGGLTRQIASLYLASVIIYGLLSLLLAAPLGAVAGNALSVYLLSVLNIPVLEFSFIPQALVFQFGTGLITPLIAALWPVFRGVSISVHQALSTYGLGSGRYGSNLLDRIMGRIRGLPSLFALMIRNTFRRPGRVALTEITLIASGAIFIMVLSTQQSFEHTIEKIFASFGFDVLVIFEQLQRIDEVTPLIESRPNVDRAEMWLFYGGYARPIGADPDDEDFEIALRGVPDDTMLFEPELVGGRNLQPQDGRAMLLNQKTAADMSIEVGSQIILDLEGVGESTWTIVGLILDISTGPDQNSAYVLRDVINVELNQKGRASVAEVRGSVDTVAGQLAIEEDLLDFFESRGVGVANTQTALEIQEQASAQFGIITTVLLVMTTLIALVGSLGLSGTLSINVIERRREIGVMRAVGASSWDVGTIFMGEGLILGILSWMQAIPLGFFAGQFFVQQLGPVLEFPFAFEFSTTAVWIWLVLIVVLSIAASWLPSLRATRISVNESLAYE